MVAYVLWEVCRLRSRCCTHSKDFRVCLFGQTHAAANGTSGRGLFPKMA